MVREPADRHGPGCLPPGLAGLSDDVSVQVPEAPHFGAGASAQLDLVVLARDFEEHGLVKGDVGAVVHRYSDNEAFEVEFVTSGGSTIAVLTLECEDIRPVSQREVLHVRELVAA